MHLLPLIFGLPTAAAEAPAPVAAGARIEEPGAVRVEAGAGGTAAADLGVHLTLVAGLHERVEVETNVAHHVLGLVNVHAKAGLVDRPAAALAATAGFGWLDPARMWYLPELDPTVDEAVLGLDLFIVPLSLVGTLTPAERVEADLALGYDHAVVVGRVDGETLLLDGAVGVRRLWAAPALRVRLGERFGVGARVTLPGAAAARTAVVAEVPVEEGVVAGVRSAGWYRIPGGSTATGRLWAEAVLGDLRLRAGGSTSALVRAMGLPVVPYVDVSWRVR